MPSTRKKTPAANLKKKVTASARARVSVRKAKKASSELHGSYIEPVSTVTATVNDTVTTSNDRIAHSSSNDAILSLLQDMNRSNQDRVRRIDPLEHQQSANSSPIVMRSQSQVHSHLASFTTDSISDPTQDIRRVCRALKRLSRTLVNPEILSRLNITHQRRINLKSLLQTPFSIRTPVAMPSCPAMTPCAATPYYLRQFHRSCPPMKVKPGWMHHKVRHQIHDARVDLMPLILSQPPQN